MLQWSRHSRERGNDRGRIGDEARCLRLSRYTDADYWEDSVAITKLAVENFKSFDKIEVDLRPFNIVVGSNASGKSNFLDALRFLHDIEANTLESAIGSRGGAETLRNFNLDKNRALRICVETDDIQRNLVRAEADRAFGVKSVLTSYELSLCFDESDVGFNVVTDRLTEHFTIVELHPTVDVDGSDVDFWLPIGGVSSQSDLPPGTYKEGRSLGSGKTLYHREAGSIKCCVEIPEGVPFSEEDISHLHDDSFVLHHPQQVMLERFPRIVFLSRSFSSLEDISVYDFDPRKPQQAVPITGARRLDADTANLAVVLREIIRRPELKGRLISLLSALLPFVHDLGVEEFGFGQLITTLTESHSDRNHRLPAVLASDGTIACIALVVALYFQHSAVAIFEEPDRYVHPHLAGQIMQMISEVTDRMQVIFTTHNPELLRHASLEDILLVTRGSEGCSEVTRPADSDVVKLFLQSELGVEDLFAQNLLPL